MKLSIISPVFNEEEVLPYFIGRTEKVCENLLKDEVIKDYEIIMIDDGSTDNTWNIIEKGHAGNVKIRGVKFSRNFGHHSTTIAGLDHAKGDFAVFMDSDLQAQPEDVPRLVQEFFKGFDVVWGIAKQRGDNFFVRTVSRIFYWIFNKITGVKIFKETVMAGCNRVAIDHIRRLREVRQFAPALWMYVGFKTSSIEVDKKERFKGTVKYSLGKRLNLALVGIIGFSKLPLQIANFIGFLMSCIGLVLGVFMVTLKLFLGIPVPGYASIIAVVTFFFGIQFMILGIMGEYIGIILDEVKRRPIYIAEKVLE
jgi:glycosyltransferase involved in cell wall biosynthesis